MNKKIKQNIDKIYSLSGKFAELAKLRVFLVPFSSYNKLLKDL